MVHEDCIFCKIVAREVPATIVHEDDAFVVFEDIHPAAPVHLLVIPRHHIVSLDELTPDDDAWVARMMRLAPKLAYAQGANPLPAGGYRVVVNAGVEGGQEIDHLHFHILGGARPWKQRAAPAA